MQKRKTQDEYIKEVSERNPYVEVLGQYVNANTKILHRCKKCGNEWMQKPAHILAGHGCKICSDKYNGYVKQKTTSQFIEEVKLINDKIKISGEYIGANRKILCECLTCGFEWSPIASSIVNGKTGCPKCAGKYKTNNEFINSLPNHVQNNILFLNEYVNSKEKIKCKCKICNNIWFSLPSNLQRGHGCMICSGKMKLDKNMLVNSLPQEVIDHVDVIGEYINAHKKISCRCKICGNVWNATIDVLKRGGICPVCAHKRGGLKLRKSHNDFIKTLSKVNQNIDINSKYISSSEKIECECKNCGFIWKTLPYNLLKGASCPRCRSSKGEKCISNVLSSLDINYITQYKFSGLKGVGNKLLSYDFYLYDYNLLIEFQGAQHFYAVDYFGGIKRYIKQQIHDLRKRKYAQEHNINLLTIWYDEIDKIPKILNQYLNNLKLESVTTVIPSIAI